jgi:hypothetical protein
MDMGQPPEPDRNEPSWLFIGMVVLILAGFALTAFYGVQLLRSYRIIHRTPLRPGVTDVSLVRDWMTIPYIARAYRVPEEVLWQGLGIPRVGNRFKSLRTLDREYAGGTPGAIQNKVKALISQYEVEHPRQVTPTPLPPSVQARPPGPLTVLAFHE